MMLRAPLLSSTSFTQRKPWETSTIYINYHIYHQPPNTSKTYSKVQKLIRNPSKTRIIIFANNQHHHPFSPFSFYRGPWSFRKPPSLSSTRCGNRPTAPQHLKRSETPQPGVKAWGCGLGSTEVPRYHCVQWQFGPNLWHFFGENGWKRMMPDETSILLWAKKKLCTS